MSSARPFGASVRLPVRRPPERPSSGGCQSGGSAFLRRGDVHVRWQKDLRRQGFSRTVMNFINLNPVQGSFLERMNPRNWIHGSLHPKPTGHTRSPAAEDVPGERAARPGRPAYRPGTPRVEATVAFRNTGGVAPVLVPRRPSNRPRVHGARSSGRTVRQHGAALHQGSALLRTGHRRLGMCLTRADGSWLSTSQRKSPAARLGDGLVQLSPQIPHGPRAPNSGVQGPRQPLANASGELLHRQRLPRRVRPVPREPDRPGLKGGSAAHPARHRRRMAVRRRVQEGAFPPPPGGCCWN